MPTPALQPGRFEVSTRCHTFLSAFRLLFSLLFAERSPQNSVPNTTTPIMPACNGAPPCPSPRFDSSRTCPLHTSCSDCHISSSPSRKTEACKSRGIELSFHPPQVILAGQSGGTVAAGTVGRFKEPSWAVFGEWIPDCSLWLVVLVLYLSFESTEFNSLHFLKKCII